MKLLLPKPKLIGEKSLEESINKRISIRSFKKKEIEIEKISQILWAAQGKKDSKRTVPSAGATYPLVIYVNVKDNGFFHYNINNHTLELVVEEDLSKKLTQASWDQHFIAEAYLNIVICAIYSRTTQRYGERGIRYVYIEVGHCAQNVHLEAVSLGLGSVPVGAFNDTEVKRVLKLSRQIEPLYIIPIGYSK
jgi:SagB-type dehydrogenase family enzyme